MPHTGSVQPQRVASQTALPTWRLELLGGAMLCDVATKHRLERKTAALLALLSQGEQTRSFVAGLLWSDTDEHHARGNLR